MPTPILSARVPPDRRAEAERRAHEEHLSLGEYVNAAIEERNGRMPCGNCARAEQRAAVAEARLAEAQAELAELRARVAGIAGVQVPAARAGADQEDRLLAALEAATPERPVTVHDLSVLSGYSAATLSDRVSLLVELGYATKPRKGLYVPVPGKDLKEGLREVKDRWAAYQRDRRHAQTVPAPPASPSPAPAPVKPAAKTTRARKASSGTPRHVRPLPAAVAELQEKVPGLVPASELLAPPPVFRAGPEMDCLHENMRLTKGPCPDCKQWVVKK